MRLARFDSDRLGLVEDDLIFDVTAALDALPALRWPLAPGDQLIAQLDRLRAPIAAARADAKPLSVHDIALRSPVANASKIIAAPANYRSHVEIDSADPGVDVNGIRAQLLEMDRPVDKLGLFLKSSTSLVGPAEGIALDWPEPGRRFDHEVELAIVIGRTARHVRRDDALGYVAGYAIGLDITMRGAEDRSFRKSLDSFSVLGPWLVTADEMPDPGKVTFWIEVNGEQRQRASSASITVGLAELIEIASRAYTLYPGDIIMTGTPDGVGPIAPGDVVTAGCEGIGTMRLEVRAPQAVSTRDVPQLAV